MEMKINFIKKVKSIANTICFKKWQIFDVIKETDDVYIIIHNWEIYCFNKWMFEEVREEPKPKFKVWDYVVHEDWKRFIKIIDIKITEDNSFIYNHDGLWYYRDSELRKPTQEELEKYFR